MDQQRKTRVLFCCMGNICRSPTAEAVARTQAERLGVADRFEFDSAGTHDYHIGEMPDPRACEAGAGRGYDLTALRARQVGMRDFERFDRILAMDRQNLSLLRSRCPAQHRHKLGLFLEYARHCTETEVPDPYYGGAQGFAHVLDLIEDAAAGLVAAYANR